MLAFYADHYVLPLPPGHRFPMAKYALLRARVAERSPGVRLVEAPAAPDDWLKLAHDPDYVDRAVQGTLSEKEQRAIGFPWSEAMVERSRRSTGATVAAARAALTEGIAVNLAGGTHHAGRASGQGYCVFNDVAVAARVLLSEGAVGRVLVVDTDVHQGNGTAEIFADDGRVFTLSLHGEKNFPFHKEVSDLDVGLPDGTTDEAYLRALDEALAEVARRFQPDLVLWVSGVDPYQGDRLGRLALTAEGLRARDQQVLTCFPGRPRVVTMAGGYAPDVERIADLHWNTVQAAWEHWQARCRPQRAAGHPASTTA